MVTKGSEGAMPAYNDIGGQWAPEAMYPTQQAATIEAHLKV
jgi:hypothetical protein